MVITFSLEEILDETNQLDVSGKTRQWLQQEALNHNPKIEVNLINMTPLFGCNDSNDWRFSISPVIPYLQEKPEGFANTSP